MDKICTAGEPGFGYPLCIMVSPRYTVSPTVEPALELVRKYNVPGPRYTSYPTAPQFSADVDRAALRAEIARDNADPTRPLSLYFHLPFCESLCWYCGCNTSVAVRHDPIEAYLHALSQEIGKVLQQKSLRDRFNTVDLTPTTPE